MRQDKSTDIQWLTLGEAAKQLHIHTTTLRRWADEGQIPFMLTPGGHRRFAASDIARITTRRKGMHRPGPVERIWANKAFENARREISSHRNDKWLVREDPEIVDANRTISRQLMDLIFTFLSEDGESESCLREARRIGAQFGSNAQKIDLSLSEVLEASMLFRDTLLNSAFQLPGNIHIPNESLRRMLSRINKMLNAVQLGMANSFEQK
jgi:excisionase family DNA binding protein